MKIKYIEMCGFGSYRDVTRIDFTRLGNQGLFLISGPTGSGKTTIFDAIKYALFDEPSGENRESKNFRSKYADEDTETYVELCFLYRDHEYLVKRNPEYMRRAKRGKGFTKEKADAVIYLPDGSHMSGKEDVKKKIIEILGINEIQFSQIVMLAQGEFMKIILSKTEDRENLFRKLFATERYVEFQNYLKAEVNTLKNRQKENAIDFEHFVNAIEVEEEHKYFEEISRERDEKKIYDDKLDIFLAYTIDEDEERIDKYRKIIADCELNAKDITSRLTKLENRRKIQNEIKGLSLALKEKEEDRLSFIQKSLHIKKREPEIKVLSEKITKLNLQLDRYKKRNELTKLIEKLRNDLQDNISKDDKFEKHLKAIKEKLNEADKFIEANDSVLIDFEKKSKEIENKNEEISKINKTMDLIVSEGKKARKISEDFKEYTRLKSAMLEAESIYRDFLSRFLDEQAGIIAENLESNQPCPVCGSLTHPNPRKKSANAPTQDEVKEKEVIFNKKRGKLEQFSKNLDIACSNLLRDYKEIIDNIGRENKYEEVATINNLNIDLIISDLLDMHFVFKEQKNLREQELLVLSKDKQKLNEIAKKYMSYKENKKHLEIDLEEKRILKIQTEKKIETLKENEKSVLSQVKEMNEVLEFSSYDEAQNHLKDLTREKDNLEKQIKDITSRTDDLDKEILSLTSKSVALKEQLDEEKLVSEDMIYALHREEDENNKNKLEKNQLLEKTVQRKIANEKNLKNIKTFRSKNNKLLEELNFKKNLSNVANGEVKGKDNLKMETFIHITFFEQILKKANKRFSVMTNNQFELVRRKESNDKRVRSGLDLDIIDHINASIRPANTLSGGESFKAALALALGFSDVIQAYSSGIKINTMFIDEGFGSLDDESLTIAVNCLRDLSEDDIQIGIISHVEELKNRIEKQIKVKKTNLGYSRVELYN